MQLALVSAEQARRQGALGRQRVELHAAKRAGMHPGLQLFLDVLAQHERAPFRHDAEREHEDLDVGFAAGQEAFEVLDRIVMQDAHGLDPDLGQPL